MRNIATVSLVLLLSVLPSSAQDVIGGRLRVAADSALNALRTPALTSFAADQPLDWTPITFDDARKYLFSVRVALIRDLRRDDELEALCTYVELNFPDLPTSDALHFSWTPDGGVVDKRDFEKVVTRARGFVEKLRSLSPMAVRVAVSTAPAGARVILRPLLGSRVREVFSDGEFANVYRGIYEYRISKNGFDTLVGELDLVDDSRELLVCKMSQVGADADTGSCNRIAVVVKK